jgi:hypothetical protein
MSAPATGSASVTVYVATDLLDYIGGVPALANGNMTVSGASVTSATPSNSGAPYAVEFWTDAASVTTASAGLIFAFYQNGVTPNSYRIAIDNVYQTAAPQAFPNSGGNWITVQFASAGTHLVRLELTGGYLLQQTYAINSASIWKSNSAADIRAGMFGDSWFQNAAAGSWGARNIPHTLGLLMGWKPDCIAQGGTGYVNTGGTNFAWTDTHRSTYDIKRRAYDVLVFFGSINDNAAPLTTLYSAALQTWQQARAANPTAPIFVFGVPTTGTVLNATAVAMEGGPTSTAGTTLYQAFAAWGDGNSYFIPISSDLAGAWLTAANQSIYIYSGDNNHPLDPTGALYVAQRMAAKIKALLAAGPSI